MKIRTQFLTIIVAILMSASASATTLMRMSLDQLTQASTEIIRGHVISQSTQWNSGHTRIYTFTTVALDQSYKGNPPSTLVIQQPGGRVGKVQVFVAGTIQFHPQTDYLLFLERSASDSSKFLPVGMMQGGYRVYRDMATREEKLILPLGSLRRGAPTGAGAVIAGPAVPVHQFQREVAMALSTPIIIPRGTAIPIAIKSTRLAGLRRLDVAGRTTSDLFPNEGLVIPAGSPISGIAERVGSSWSISWKDVSIGGQQVLLSARNTEPAGGALQGRVLRVSVR